jgi:hypothetical protein
MPLILKSQLQTAEIFPMTMLASSAMCFARRVGKRVHCFYAGPRGKAPEATETAWYNYINNGKELLEKVIARQEIKKLSNETIDLVGSQLVNPSP